MPKLRARSSISCTSASPSGWTRASKAETPVGPDRYGSDGAFAGFDWGNRLLAARVRRAARHELARGGKEFLGLDPHGGSALTPVSRASADRQRRRGAWSR